MKFTLHCLTFLAFAFFLNKMHAQQLLPEQQALVLPAGLGNGGMQQQPFLPIGGTQQNLNSLYARLHGQGLQLPGLNEQIGLTFRGQPALLTEQLQKLAGLQVEGIQSQLGLQTGLPYQQQNFNGREFQYQRMQNELRRKSESKTHYQREEYGQRFHQRQGGLAFTKMEMGHNFQQGQPSIPIAGMELQTSSQIAKVQEHTSQQNEEHQRQISLQAEEIGQVSQRTAGWQERRARMQAGASQPGQVSQNTARWQGGHVEMQAGGSQQGQLSQHSAGWQEGRVEMQAGASQQGQLSQHGAGWQERRARMQAGANQQGQVSQLSGGCQGGRVEMRAGGRQQGQVSQHSAGWQGGLMRLELEGKQQGQFHHGQAGAEYNDDHLLKTNLQVAIAGKDECELYSKSPFSYPCLDGEDTPACQEYRKATARGEGVVTDDGKFSISCEDHSDCYVTREPNDWCRPNCTQHWRDRGCFCEANLKACVIERSNKNKAEWTKCRPKGYECTSR